MQITPYTPQFVDFAWSCGIIIRKFYRLNPTLHEIMMLIRVAKAGKEGITANELVREIGMSKASVSRWVADFVERDIMEQRKGIDGRSSTIHQTASSIVRMERWVGGVREILPMLDEEKTPTPLGD